MCDDDKVQTWVNIAPGLRLGIEYSRTDLEMVRSGHADVVDCKIIGVDATLPALGQDD